MHPTDKDLVFTIIMISFSFLSHVWKEWLSRSGICCRVCFEVHPFGTVGRSHLQPLALRRWQAVHRPSAYNCDPNPPTYCSNRVVRLQTKSCFILFINREERGGWRGENGACCGVEMRSILCLAHSHFNDPGMHANRKPQAKCELLVPGN